MISNDLVCFSHLRWNFVFQRPQHLLTRFSKSRRVFYVEEPIFFDGHHVIHVNQVQDNLWVIVPHLGHGLDNHSQRRILEQLIQAFFNDYKIQNAVFWYYTPMALEYSLSLQPELIVYDCMDELSAFKFAPPELKESETKLFEKADLVFTGGHSLYEAKKQLHHQIFSFPSSIDKEHFAAARSHIAEPEDQLNIPHPRIGFYGVIDERMDLELVKAVALNRPDWHFVLIGPVVKINEASLPKLDNIHYLGSKSYGELPLYLSGWDIAMIPFALNESTRFISPTKTPEYLAAGKPVVSSSIQDVVKPYGELKLVHIADNSDEFVLAVTKELNHVNKSTWLSEVDSFLANNSWDKTWSQMMQMIGNKLEEKRTKKENYKLTFKEDVYV